MNIPSIITLLLLLVAFFSRGTWLINVAFVLVAFGAMAIVPAKLLGGLTILASAVAFLLVFVKMALRPGGMKAIVSSLADFRGMALLCAFTALSIVGAFVLPKVFAGQVLIFPMAGAMTVMPLTPTGSNINQAADLFISFCVALAFFVMSKQEDFHERMASAFLWLGGAVVGTGIADFISPFTGLSGVLAEFRTASYMFMTDNVVLNVRRIIGLMTEASSYGTLAAFVGWLLLLTRGAFARRTRLWGAIPLGIGSLIFSVLSTSSSAYLALAVGAIVFLADSFYRLFTGTRPQKIEAIKIFIAFGIIALIGACILAANENMRDGIYRMIDATIFKKKESTSYMERSSWTAAAISAFWSTNGAGIGVGSVRTSNFFANILASDGVLGTLLFGLFILQVYGAKMRRSAGEIYELVHGAKLAMIISFAGLYLSGTTPDYGVFLGSLFGMIVGLSRFQNMRKPVIAPRVPMSIAERKTLASAPADDAAVASSIAE